MDLWIMLIFWFNMEALFCSSWFWIALFPGFITKNWSYEIWNSVNRITIICDFTVSVYLFRPIIMGLHQMRMPVSYLKKVETSLCNKYFAGSSPSSMQLSEERDLRIIWLVIVQRADELVSFTYLLSFREYLKLWCLNFLNLFDCQKGSFNFF